MPKRICWVAIMCLLSGCGPGGPKLMAGMHLPAEGTIKVDALPQNQARVSLAVNLSNVGTQTCNTVAFEVLWPSSLKDRVLAGDWSGVVEPFAPGSAGQYISTWTLRLEGLPAEQVSGLWDEVRIAVRCSDPKGYENVVTPQSQ